MIYTRYFTTMSLNIAMTTDKIAINFDILYKLRKKMLMQSMLKSFGSVQCLSYGIYVCVGVFFVRNSHII